MYVTLHPDLRLAKNALVDDRLDLHYRLTPDAAWLMRHLLAEGRIERLVSKVARLKQVPESAAKLVVYTLLGQLGSFGGVHITWDKSLGLARRLKARWVWCCRLPTSPAGFVCAAWAAYGLLYAALQLAFGCIWVLYDFELPVEFVLLPLIVFLTLVCHEGGHVVVAEKCGVAAVLLARPGYFAVMYRRPPRAVARRIACAGPIVAGLVAAGLAVCSSIPVVRIILASTALIHGLCLLPFFADGKTIWRKI